MNGRQRGDGSSASHYHTPEILVSFYYILYYRFIRENIDHVIVFAARNFCIQNGDVCASAAGRFSCLFKEKTTSFGRKIENTTRKH
jgi:hypothetical protein